MSNDGSKIIKRTNRLHAMRVIRRPFRIFVIPIWLSFSIIDYLYIPEHFLLCLGLRTFVACCWLISPYFLLIPSLKRNIQFYILGVSLLAPMTTNIMLAISGGATSSYLAGHFLVVFFAIFFFKMTTIHSIYFSLISYLPTVVICFLTSGTIVEKVLLCFFVVGYTVLSFIIRTFDYSNKIHAKFRLDAIEEQKRLRKHNFWNSHFPSDVCHAIASGHITIGEHEIIPYAFVGFADVANSTPIANQLSLDEDWRYKEDLIKSASVLARRFDFIVLGYTGDGFLFVNNYLTAKSRNWLSNLTFFFNSLNEVFSEIIQPYSTKIGETDTGIKMGGAAGAVKIGLFGDPDQLFFTASGPTVNRASRLCDVAQPGEMALSSGVWDAMKHFHSDSNISFNTSQLKGFGESRYAIFSSRGCTPKSGRYDHCPTCHNELSLLKNKLGHFEFLCLRCEQGIANKKYDHEPLRAE